MKKFIIALMISLMCLLVTGCVNSGGSGVKEMFLYVNENKLTVSLSDNKAVDALVKLLRKGDITYYADDYGGFEKVGRLGHTLPSHDTQIRTEPGDAMLYNSNQIVLFYGSNSWAYTRIGKIEGYSTDELKDLLGAGSGRIEVRLSLK